MTLTVGSLFAGIGGIELGLERAGMEVVWQVEKDDYCRKVLAKHWPDVERFEDVREVGAENLEPVDLICGGFPCQDISVAGKGEGIEGERSGLWSEMWRILRELRPRYALVENVPALRFRGLGRLLGDLAEIGYNAEWESVTAASVGAPHRRDRVFIVAYPRCIEGGEGHVADVQRRRSGEAEQVGVGCRSSGSEQRGVVADASSGRGSDDELRTGRDESGVRRAPLADAERGRLQGGVFRHRGSRTELPSENGGKGRGGVGRRSWEAEPDVGRLAHGISNRLAERSLRALGNAVVPQVAEWIGRRIMEHAEEPA